jgi:type IV fimbrial biogenesis protein FimT
MCSIAMVTLVTMVIFMLYYSSIFQTLDNIFMSKQHGITLIELLIAMAIMIITLSVSIPNLSQFFKNSELINTSNQVASIMSFARSEATKRKSTVIICQSTNGTSCTASGDSLIVLNSDNSLLRVAPLNSDINFFYQNLASSTITFNAFGIPNDVGQIVLCDDRGSGYAKGIALNVGGQIRALVKSEISNISCS